MGRRIAYGGFLAAAALCGLTIVLALLGRDGWVGKHVASWTAFMAAWNSGFLRDLNTPRATSRRGT